MKITNFNQKFISYIVTGALCFSLAANESKNFISVAAPASTISSTSLKGEKQVKIPKEYTEYIEIDKKLYTIDDLANIKSLNLEILEEKDLSWIKYCTNLEVLSITIPKQFLKDSREELNAFDDVCFENLKSFSLFSLDDTLVFNQDNFGFLQKSSNLEDLYILSEHIREDFLESLTSIKRLKLASPGFHTKIDFSKLTNLEEIDFSKTKLYDIAMFITNDDINYFRENNITIKTKEEGYIDKVIEINNQIDSIIEKLDFSSSASEEEKLEKIATYVINNFNYDELVSEMFYAKDEEIDAEFEEYIGEKFYREGPLTKAFEGDGSIICGNYAAFTFICANRSGINSYFMKSNKHAWVLVELDGKYYYLDPTYMDSSINKNIPIKERQWFLYDANSVPIEDKSHMPYNLSDDITIESFEAYSNYYKSLQESLENDKKKLKTLIISGSLIPFSSAVLLIAMILKRKKNKKELVADDVMNNSENKNQKTLKM